MRLSLLHRILGLALPLVVAFASLAARPSNLPRAIAAQEEILATRPADAQAHNDYGNLMLLAGAEDVAENAYRRAVELDPGLVSARYNLALLLEQRGALKEALGQLEAVLELRPRHAWAHYQSGRIAERQGRDRVAVAAYAEAFRLDAGLSFPEVNPQVLDSELVTQALLKTRPDVRGASEAPRIYEEPTRIASLLLPRIQQAGEEAGSDSPAAPASPGAGHPGEPADGDALVLQPDDLQTGSRVGEASPAVPAPSPAPRSSAPGGWGVGQPPRLERQKAPPTTPGTTGGGFRPGSRSTGQSRLQIREDG
jgi:hypothetical protein